MITQDTYRKALARVADADYAIAQSFQDDDVDAVATLFSRIEKDCASIFPDLKIFQPGGPLSDDLVNVTKAYSFYRSGFAYIAGSHAVAATLLINLDSYNAFVALANALNRPLALAFLSGDEMAVLTPFYTLSDPRNINIIPNSTSYSRQISKRCTPTLRTCCSSIQTPISTASFAAFSRSTCRSISWLAYGTSLCSRETRSCSVRRWRCWRILRWGCMRSGRRFYGL